MNEAAAGLLLLVSAATLRLSLSDAYLRYVKEGMRPWLIVTGVLLGLLGVAALRGRHDRSDDDAAVDEAEPGEDAHVPRPAWLLVLPVLGIFLIAPAPLGSYAAGRQSARFAAPRSGFPVLPARVDGAVPMSLNEYTLRTIYDTGESLRGQRVRLVGFVTAGAGPTEFVLTRFAIACCAADGIAMKVRVRGVGSTVPAVETWVTVEGDWVAPDRAPDGEIIESRLPVLSWQGMQVIPAPSHPYE